MSVTFKLVPRSKIVGFYGLPTEDGAIFKRMRKFTQFSRSANAVEYNRKYVDEACSITDIIGYSPSIAYSFDKHTGIDVLDDIINITNGEYVGEDAVRTIIIVDIQTGKATMRDYTIVPATDGDNTAAYTYNGTFKCHGDLIKGEAKSEDGWETISFFTGLSEFTNIFDMEMCTINELKAHTINELEGNV